MRATLVTIWIMIVEGCDENEVSTGIATRRSVNSDSASTYQHISKFSTPRQRTNLAAQLPNVHTSIMRLMTSGFRDPCMIVSAITMNPMCRSSLLLCASPCYRSLRLCTVVVSVALRPLHQLCASLLSLPYVAPLHLQRAPLVLYRPCASLLSLLILPH